MFFRPWGVRLLSLVLLWTTACSGTVLGGQAICSGSVELITQVSGDCERTIETLEEAETQHIAVQTMDVAPFATVAFAVTVEAGVVLVRFVNARGNEETFEVQPGASASGSVRVQLDPLSRINFDLEPIGGPASGVEYHLNFVCDCLP